METIEDLLRARRGLEEAIATGATKVRVNGHEVHYATHDEMQARLTWLNQRIGDRKTIGPIAPISTSGY
ncbi:MAG: hypothetical protein AAF221_01035 [Pseudomonadota bacterium]